MKTLLGIFLSLALVIGILAAACWIVGGGEE